MSLLLDKMDKRDATEVILRVAKGERRWRERHLRMHPDEKPKTTLLQDVIRHVRHWRDDISEADIRKVMRGEAL